MASSIFYSQNLAADQYINWGVTSGSNGYGIRDNAGTIEFKDTGGSWAPISSSSSGGGWQRVGTVVSLVTGTDTIGSNLRPTDATYTLGDSTHGWLDAYLHTTAIDGSQGLFVQTGSAPVATLYPVATDGSMEFDLGPAGDGGAWVFNYGSSFDIYATQVNIFNNAGLTVQGGGSFGGTAFEATYQLSTIGLGSLGALKTYKNVDASADVAQAVNFMQIDWTSTTSASDLGVGLGVLTTFATGAKGSIQNFTSLIAIDGSGSDSNEYANFVGAHRVDIGTGYTQTTGPVGNNWFADFGMHSAINIQPTMFGGVTMGANFYYNGSPTLATSYQYAAATYPNIGPGNDVTHGSATSYPWDDGFIVVGKSGTIGSPTGVGFTTAFRAGGTGSNWQVAGSKIGTGLDVSDFTTRGIYVHNPSATTAPDVKFTGFFEGTEMTAPVAGAVNTGRLYFEDSGGKTRLMCLFNTGAAQQIAIQP